MNQQPDATVGGDVVETEPLTVRHWMGQFPDPIRPRSPCQTGGVCPWICMKNSKSVSRK